MKPRVPGYVAEKKESNTYHNVYRKSWLPRFRRFQTCMGLGKLKSYVFRLSFVQHDGRLYCKNKSKTNHRWNFVITLNSLTKHVWKDDISFVPLLWYYQSVQIIINRISYYELPNHQPLFTAQLKTPCTRCCTYSNPAFLQLTPELQGLKICGCPCHKHVLKAKY